MDISQFDTSTLAESGVEYVVLNPMDDRQTDITMTLAGTDSSFYRNAISAQARKSSDRKREKIDLEEAEQNTCEILAACTLGWSGLLEGGKELKYSKQNAIDLYKKHKWLRQQVDRFIGDRANFFPLSLSA